MPAASTHIERVVFVFLGGVFASLPLYYSNGSDSVLSSMVTLLPYRLACSVLTALNDGIHLSVQSSVCSAVGCDHELLHLTIIIISPNLPESFKPSLYIKSFRLL